jgi:hypothetical protein
MIGHTIEQIKTFKTHEIQRMIKNMRKAQNSWKISGDSHTQQHIEFLENEIKKLEEELEQRMPKTP